MPTTVDAGPVQEAIAFLRRSDLPLDPRKKWPPGGLPSLGVRGNTSIPEDRNLQPGKILCMWGDAGWGQLVRRGKYQDGHFSDELVTACAALVNAWSPAPPLQWGDVYSIASPSRPCA
ncbi:MAG: hypothetical protein WDN00_09110 [Limisphaerales bacterium]